MADWPRRRCCATRGTRALPRRAARRREELRLIGAAVSAFLVRECGRVSLRTPKGRVAVLRSLLRFLHLRGLSQSALAEAVPPVAGWRQAAIPQTISRAEVERLLGCWSPRALTTPAPWRSRCAVRPGLRALEVAREVGRFRRSYLVTMAEVADLAELNARLLAACEGDLARRISGRSGTVGEALACERSCCGRCPPRASTPPRRRTRAWTLRRW